MTTWRVVSHRVKDMVTIICHMTRVTVTRAHTAREVNNLGQAENIISRGKVITKVSRVITLATSRVKVTVVQVKVMVLVEMVRGSVKKEFTRECTTTGWGQGQEVTM